MAELDESIVQEASSRGEQLSPSALVALVEVHHSTELDRPGVDEELIFDYVDEVCRNNKLDPEAFADAVTQNRTESEDWTGEEAVYVVEDGRLSTFPKRWHDELRGETDLLRHLGVILSIVDSEEAFARGGQGPGVPNDVLVDSAAVLGGVSSQEASDEVERLRDEGYVYVAADQHPKAKVELTDSGKRALESR